MAIEFFRYKDQQSDKIWAIETNVNHDMTYTVWHGNTREKLQKKTVSSSRSFSQCMDEKRTKGYQCVTGFIVDQRYQTHTQPDSQKPKRRTVFKWQIRALSKEAHQTVSDEVIKRLVMKSSIFSQDNLSVILILISSPIWITVH